MKKEDIELVRIKAQDRLNVNLWLLSTSFLMFTFIVALNSELLKNNFFLSIQLALSIPLFMDAVFARQKIAYAKNKRKWNSYGFVTFVLAYGFLINIMGILISGLVNIQIGMIFFAINILSAMVYSAFEISEDKSKLKSRIYKDLFFIIIILFLGILPSLKVY